MTKFKKASSLGKAGSIGFTPKEAKEIRKNFIPVTNLDHLAMYLDGTKFSPESFDRFFDSNLRKKGAQAFNLKWIKNGGAKVDQLALSVQNDVQGYNVKDETEIIEDIQYLITTYPAGFTEYYFEASQHNEDEYNDNANYSDMENEIEREQANEAFEAGLKKSFKPKTRLKRTVKTVTKTVTKRKTVNKTKQAYTPELAILKRFFALHNKPVKITQLTSLQSGLKAAIATGKNHMQLIKTINAKLNVAIIKLQNANIGNIKKFEISKDLLAKVTAVVTAPQVKQVTLGGLKKKAISEFEPTFKQFKGKPVEAIKYLQKEKKGQCTEALYRADIGFVDIVWGENNTKTNVGYGLKHIIEKHEHEIKELGFDVANFIATVFAYGDLKKHREEDKIILDSNMFRLVVKTTWNGNKKAFVLTAFDLRKKALKSNVGKSALGALFSNQPLSGSLNFYSANVNKNNTKKANNLGSFSAQQKEAIKEAENDVKNAYAKLSEAKKKGKKGTDLKIYVDGVQKYVEAYQKAKGILPKTQALDKTQTKLFETSKGGKLFGLNAYRFEGKNYRRTQDLSIKDLVELIKIEVLAEFPKKEGYKFSITSSNYDHINLTLLDAPFNPFSVPYQIMYMDDIPFNQFWEETKDEWNRSVPVYNKKGIELIEKLETFVNQYNFNDSDAMTDYFHVRFYDKIKIDDDKFIDKYYPENLERKAQKARSDEWDEKAKKRNAEAKERREASGNYKKNELVWFTRPTIHPSWNKYLQPNGKFLAKISKATNGRGFSNDIHVTILQETTDKEVFERYEKLKIDAKASKNSWQKKSLESYYFIVDEKLFVPLTKSIIVGTNEIERIAAKTKLNGLGNATNEVAEVKGQQPKASSQKNPFQTMDKLVSGGTYQLEGERGKLLGNLGQVDCSITIRGDQGAGKSQLMWQLVDDFAEIGKNVAVVSPEMNGSSPTISKYRDKYIKPKNQNKVLFTDKKLTVKAIKDLSNAFDVVFVDSFNQLENYEQSQFDWLCKQLPNKCIVGLFQSTTGGEMRGGNKPEFDAYVNIEVVKVDDSFINNYAVCTKNRFGGTGAKYNVSTQKIMKESTNGLSGVAKKRAAKKVVKKVTKSVEASKVLKLMDDDYSYQDALKLVLSNNKNIDKTKLEKELNKYI